MRIVIFDGSLGSPLWLFLAFCPNILERWWGPMNAICLSVNIGEAVILFGGPLCPSC